MKVPEGDMTVALWDKRRLVVKDDSFHKPDPEDIEEQLSIF